ncbi:hypothetical protein A3Q56_02558 [Intoshia linei]|uniref:Uncharacterized protein n=1 Tax=Intoshia linei TaxID=1819745 RepID=A0A177B7W8_9BILA|nr:hypothetical protein A3Q56_02558 [Intoshia linei]
MTSMQPINNMEGLPAMPLAKPIQMAQPGVGQTTVVIQNFQTPSSHLALAIFVTILFLVIILQIIIINMIILKVLGLIAILFSVMSSSAADENNMVDAKSKGKISLYLSITGKIVTLIVAVILIAYFVQLSVNTISNLSTVDSLNNALPNSNLYTSILIQ